tara:strand:- start:4083 stop:4439 length:357 start_codon:yes stop_codon:yes gene_type:complete
MNNKTKKIGKYNCNGICIRNKKITLNGKEQDHISKLANNILKNKVRNGKLFETEIYVQSPTNPNKYIGMVFNKKIGKPLKVIDIFFNKKGFTKIVRGTEPNNVLCNVNCIRTKKHKKL